MLSKYSHQGLRDSERCCTILFAQKGIKGLRLDSLSSTIHREWSRQAQRSPSTRQVLQVERSHVSWTTIGKSQYHLLDRSLAKPRTNVPQKIPRKTPPMTSLGKCNPKMIIETPVAIARTTKGTRQAVYLDHITVATVNAFVVCPDGNPGLVGISPRSTIPSEGIWNGLGRLKDAFNTSVRVIAVTIATASISELVHSVLSLRKT